MKAQKPTIESFIGRHSLFTNPSIRDTKRLYFGLRFLENLLAISSPIILNMFIISPSRTSLKYFSILIGLYGLSLHPIKLGARHFHYFSVLYSVQYKYCFSIVVEPYSINFHFRIFIIDSIVFGEQLNLSAISLYDNPFLRKSLIMGISLFDNFRSRLLIAL